MTEVKKGWRTHKPGCKCRPCTASRGESTAKKRNNKTNPNSAKGGDFFDDLDEEAVALAVITATPTRSLRNTIAKWKLMRIQQPNWSTARIATELGMSKASLYRSIGQARKKGILKIEDVEDQIEHVLKPKVMENIEHYLNEKDKEMTIQAAKGIGIFTPKQGSADQPTTVIGIKIEMPPGADNVSENIAGVGHYTEGDSTIVVEEVDEE